MKKIVSVSIGSSLRDKTVETELLGERFLIKRIGTDGNIKKAVDIINVLDGKVDAFGMGGIDMYLSAGPDRKYMIRDAIPIKNAARETPIVDGSGLKKTLEKRVVEYLESSRILDLKGKKVLVTSAADRYGMAEAFAGCGCEVLIGDFIFALGIPMVLKNMEAFQKVAGAAIPLVSKLPFSMLYPTGKKQKEINNRKFERYYRNADIIAGDFHYIKKFMPDNLEEKAIITNTVTIDDVEMMKKRGVRLLITTTPEFDGRSFGTNVMEALIITITRKSPEIMTDAEYYTILEKLNFKPRIENLN